MCVQGCTIATRNARGNGTALNAHGYENKMGSATALPIRCYKRTSRQPREQAQKFCRIWCSPAGDRVPSLPGSKPLDRYQHSVSYLANKGISPTDDIVEGSGSQRTFAEPIERSIEEAYALTHCLIEQYGNPSPLWRADAGTPKDEGKIIALPGGTPDDKGTAARIGIVGHIGKPPLIDRQALHVLLEQRLSEVGTDTATAADPGSLSEVGARWYTGLQRGATDRCNQRITGRSGDTLDEGGKGTTDLCRTTITRGSQECNVLCHSRLEYLMLEL